MRYVAKNMLNIAISSHKTRQLDIDSLFLYNFVVNESKFFKYIIHL